jgi:hypothetical protein
LPRAAFVARSMHDPFGAGRLAARSWVRSSEPAGAWARRPQEK